MIRTGGLNEQHATRDNRRERSTATLAALSVGDRALRVGPGHLCAPILPAQLAGPLARTRAGLAWGRAHGCVSQATPGRGAHDLSCLVRPGVRLRMVFCADRNQVA